MAHKDVCYSTSNRQWDARINVPTDEYLEKVLSAIRDESGKGRLKYILVGGIEIGTKPNHTDYQVRHVHIAAIYHNNITKSAIVKNWNILEGHGYYLVPRNRDLPYKGWREHHTKAFSKVDPNPEKHVLYEAGELPRDEGQGVKRKGDCVTRSEKEKKLKTDEVIIEIRKLLEAGKKEEAFEQYPLNYLRYGEKISSLIEQKRQSYFGTIADPHLYVHGFPGTGKTSLLQFLYPRNYKKDLSCRFWELFDPKKHSHVILEDFDSNCLDNLGLQWFKTICDEAGFNYDQKFKSTQLGKATILVTSNQDLDSLITQSDETKLVMETRRALHRRFWQIRVDVLQRLLGLKLIPEFERKQLKRAGNEDPAKLYMDWDYINDCPTGLPLKQPEYYQGIIRDTYYGVDKK